MNEEKDIQNEITLLDNNSIVDIDKKTQDVANDILKANDLSEIKDLTNLFNLNIQKKNIIRLLKLNGLQDTVIDKLIERVEKRPDEITNRELIEFLNTTQTAIEKSNNRIEGIGDTPILHLNQQNNQVNININNTDDNKNTLDRDSRNNVIDAVTAILNSIQKQDSRNIEENNNSSVVVDADIVESDNE